MRIKESRNKANSTGREASSSATEPSGLVVENPWSDVKAKSVAQDLLRGLRGRRSQQFLNRRLNFRSNQVHKWETGQNQISWEMFIHVCTVRSVAIDRLLLNAFLFHSPPERIDLLLQHLLPKAELKTHASSLGVSPQTLRRWYKGESDLGLATILQIFSLLPGQAENFVIRLCEAATCLPPEQLQSWPGSPLEILFRHPIAGALTAALELDEYISQTSHPTGWLAQKLGSTEDEIESALHALQEVGAIRQAGIHYASENLTIDTSGANPSSRLRLRGYWFDRFVRAIGLRKLSLAGRSQLTYFVHALSEDGRHEIKGLLQAFYRDVDRVIRKDRVKKKSSVCYVGIDLIDLSET